MKVFVTGASGYLGREIVDLLLAEGHHVAGQVRSEAKAADLRKRGVEPVVCGLEDTAALAKAASTADAVIHTAFDHYGPSYMDAIDKDMAATLAMTAALEGTDKAFMSSSGTGILGDTGPAPVDEQFPVDIGFALVKRSQAEREVVFAAGKGVRAMVMRLPPYVWGKGGSCFIPVQLESAPRLGKAYYILPGTQGSTAVHVEDAARAYVLALEHGKAGNIYNITSNWDFTNKDIAEAVSANVGVPMEGITLEDALSKGIWAEWLCTMFALNTRASGAKAARELRWKAEHIDVLADVRAGSYKKH